MIRYEKCTGTGKTRFPDPGAAKQAREAIVATKRKYSDISGKRYNRRSGKRVQARYYYCYLCNGYHLTSSVVPLNQKTKEKIYYQRLKETDDFIKNPDDAEAWKADGLPFPEQKTNND